MSRSAARQTSALPTRKWWANLVIAVVGLLTDWQTAAHGAWGQAQTVMAITIAGAAIVAYLVPNAPDAEPVHAADTGRAR